MLIEKTGNSGFKRGCQKTRWPTSSVGLVFFWFAKLVCDFFLISNWKKQRPDSHPEMPNYRNYVTVDSLV